MRAISGIGSIVPISLFAYIIETSPVFFERYCSKESKIITPFSSTERKSTGIFNLSTGRYVTSKPNFSRYAQV